MGRDAKVLASLCAASAVWIAAFYALFYWHDTRFWDSTFHSVCRDHHPTLPDCVQRYWAEATIWDRVFGWHHDQWLAIAAVPVIVLGAWLAWSLVRRMRKAGTAK